MNIIRTLLAVLSLVAAIPAALQAWVASDEASILNTIHHMDLLNQQFIAASAIVEEFRKHNHRLPSQAEFKELPPKFFFEVQIDKAEFPKEAVEAFGLPPLAAAEPYLLIESGYDVPQYWASWLRRSNAITDARAFYLLGTSRSDTAFFGTVALILLCTAALLWPRPNPSFKRDAAKARRPLTLR